MIARNVTVEQMATALGNLNKQYEGNVEFNDIRREGRGVRFRLRVKSSKGPGARRGFTGRRLISACWHVHGHYFEEVFKVAPDAEIISRSVNGGRITRHGGNWQDGNIGSMMYPLYFSEACDCGKQ